MSDHTVGQWPVKQPVRLASVPAPVAELAPTAPPAVVPVPEVRLVVTVDLTGRYDRSSDVTADLYEQTRHSTDCHTAVVRVGEEALRCESGLGQAIASRFFLAAKRIEVHVPAGTRWAFVASEVQRHLRIMTADHARMLDSMRTPGG
ncbi:hypothetical protein ACFWEH_13055 [Streptomyces anulatus]|uniref:hypothetical protein n=1 Tax=Streptomyces TaxID=1883 RepID=UPI000939EC16|nr:hypothetical protein [Streptomyces sp. TSRI0395]OKI83792.1 hypothetical protein AMK12_11765 [Streptomyces sp. TSRI0395]